MWIKEILRPGPQGGISTGTTIVSLTTEHLTAIRKRIGLLKKETAISWLAEVALTGIGSGSIVLDIVYIFQEFKDTCDFSALSVAIKNCTVQNSAVIRDEILKLFYPTEPLVVLFHKERQGAGERPEAYLERRKFVFVSAGLALPLQGNANGFNFDV